MIASVLKDAAAPMSTGAAEASPSKILMLFPRRDFSKYDAVVQTPAREAGTSEDGPGAFHALGLGGKQQIAERAG